MPFTSTHSFTFPSLFTRESRLVFQNKESFVEADKKKVLDESDQMAQDLENLKKAPEVLEKTKNLRATLDQLIAVNDSVAQEIFGPGKEKDKEIFLSIIIQQSGGVDMLASQPNMSALDYAKNKEFFDRHWSFESEKAKRIEKLNGVLATSKIEVENTKKALTDYQVTTPKATELEAAYTAAETSRNTITNLALPTAQKEDNNSMYEATIKEVTKQIENLTVDKNSDAAQEQKADLLKDLENQKACLEAFKSYYDSFQNLEIEKKNTPEQAFQKEFFVTKETAPSNVEFTQRKNLNFAVLRFQEALGVFEGINIDFSQFSFPELQKMDLRSIILTQSYLYGAETIKQELQTVLPLTKESLQKFQEPNGTAEFAKIPYIGGIIRAFNDYFTNKTEVPNFISDVNKQRHTLEFALKDPERMIEVVGIDVVHSYDRYQLLRSNNRIPITEDVNTWAGHPEHAVKYLPEILVQSPRKEWLIAALKISAQDIATEQNSEIKEKLKLAHFHAQEIMARMIVYFRERSGEGGKDINLSDAAEREQAQKLKEAMRKGSSGVLGELVSKFLGSREDLPATALMLAAIGYMVYSDKKYRGLAKMALGVFAVDIAVGRMTGQGMLDRAGLPLFHTEGGARMMKFLGEDKNFAENDPRRVALTSLEAKQCMVSLETQDVPMAELVAEYRRVKLMGGSKVKEARFNFSNVENIKYYDVADDKGKASEVMMIILERFFNSYAIENHVQPADAQNGALKIYEELHDGSGKEILQEVQDGKGGILKKERFTFLEYFQRTITGPDAKEHMENNKNMYDTVTSFLTTVPGESWEFVKDTVFALIPSLEGHSPTEIFQMLHIPTTKKEYLEYVAKLRDILPYLQEKAEYLWKNYGKPGVNFSWELIKTGSAETLAFGNAMRLLVLEYMNLIPNVSISKAEWDTPKKRSEFLEKKFLGYGKEFDRAVNSQNKVYNSDSKQLFITATGVDEDTEGWEATGRSKARENADKNIVESLKKYLKGEGKDLDITNVHPVTRAPLIDNKLPTIKLSDALIKYFPEAVDNQAINYDKLVDQLLKENKYFQLSGTVTIDKENKVNSFYTLDLPGSIIFHQKQEGSWKDSGNPVSEELAREERSNSTLTLMNRYDQVPEQGWKEYFTTELREKGIGFDIANGTLHKIRDGKMAMKPEVVKKFGLLKEKDFELFCSSVLDNNLPKPIGISALRAELLFSDQGRVDFWKKKINESSDVWTVEKLKEKQTKAVNNSPISEMYLTLQLQKISSSNEDTAVALTKTTDALKELLTRGSQPLNLLVMTKTETELLEKKTKIIPTEQKPRLVANFQQLREHYVDLMLRASLESGDQEKKTEIEAEEVYKTWQKRIDNIKKDNFDLVTDVENVKENLATFLEGMPALTFKKAEILKKVEKYLEGNTHKGKSLYYAEYVKYAVLKNQLDFHNSWNPQHEYTDLPNFESTVTSPRAKVTTRADLENKIATEGVFEWNLVDKGKEWNTEQFQTVALDYFDRMMISTPEIETDGSKAYANYLEFRILETMHRMALFNEGFISNSLQYDSVGTLKSLSLDINSQEITHFEAYHLDDFGAVLSWEEFQKIYEGS